MDFSDVLKSPAIRAIITAQLVREARDEEIYGAWLIGAGPRAGWCDASASRTPQRGVTSAVKRE